MAKEENSLSVPDLLLLNEFNNRQADNMLTKRKLIKVRQLMFEGYLRFATTEETLSFITISELKEILKINDQALKGSKNELVNRIIQNIPLEKYSSHLPEVYIATERGQKELEKRYYYIECCGFSIAEISEMEKKYSGDKILEQLFLRDIVRHWNDSNFGLLRNVYLTMHGFYKRRNRLKKSVLSLLAVLYYDLTGAGNNGMIEDYKNIEWAFKTSLWDELNKECVALNVSFDELANLFEEVTINIVVPPFSYFEVEIMKKIIIDRLNGQMDLLESYKKFHKEPFPERKIKISEKIQLREDMLILPIIENEDKIGSQETEYKLETKKTPRLKKSQDNNFVSQRNKGNSLIVFPQDYTMVDLETTGYSTRYDSIIEVGCIKYRDGKEVARYSTLVRPPIKITPYMEILTKITNEMVSSAPKIEEIAQEVWEFLEGEIIVGHNVNFDINFLYDNFKRTIDKELSNDFVDTLRLARKLLPKLKEEGGYNLDNLCSYWGVEPLTGNPKTDELEKIVDRMVYASFGYPNRHRAINDCVYTNEVLKKLKEYVAQNNVDMAEIAKKEKRKENKQYRISRENLRNMQIDTDTSHIFYGKNCVFTGRLEEMQRSEAKQIVTQIGGNCESNVTKNTNFIIVGDMDYKAGLEGYETAKLKKAKQLIEQGQELQIIPESAFYDLIEEYLTN